MLRSISISFPLSVFLVNEVFRGFLYIKQSLGIHLPIQWEPHCPQSNLSLSSFFVAEKSKLQTAQCLAKKISWVRQGTRNIKWIYIFRWIYSVFNSEPLDNISVETGQYQTKNSFKENTITFREEIRLEVQQDVQSVFFASIPDIINFPHHFYIAKGSINQKWIWFVSAINHPLSFLTGRNRFNRQYPPNVDIFSFFHKAAAIWKV